MTRRRANWAGRPIWCTPGVRQSRLHDRVQVPRAMAEDRSNPRRRAAGCRLRDDAAALRGAAGLLVRVHATAGPSCSTRTPPRFCIRAGGGCSGCSACSAGGRPRRSCTTNIWPRARAEHGAHATVVPDVPVVFSPVEPFRGLTAFTVAVVCSFNYDEPLPRPSWRRRRWCPTSSSM